MMIPFFKSDSLTAIRADIDFKSVHIGILVVNPYSTEVQELSDGFKFHLTDELINQNVPKVALEMDFQVFSE